ncbi:MAG TPA: tRNA lysidine(34) synthetase TilS [Thermotogota bacterium]|nr:tRNA lysidine(34) synthetase TilS [Thermotogota bacterium]
MDFPKSVSGKISCLLSSFFQPFQDTSHRFVLAISGGVDSMVLLHGMRSLFQHELHRLVVAHVHHGMRPQSDEEYRFLEQLCARDGIAFVGKKLDPVSLPQNGANLEAVFRKERYAFFRQVQQSEKGALLVTAHHGDDRVETVFLRLFRGCGLNGFSGFSAREGELLRPFVPLEKAELRAYARENGLHFFEDHSNADNRFLRNRVRNLLLPFLRNHFGKGVTRTLARDFALVHRGKVALEFFLQEYVLRAAVFSEQGCWIPIEKWECYPGEVQDEALLRLYQRWKGDPEGLDAQKMQSIRARLDSSHGYEFQYQLAKGIFFRRTRQSVGFFSTDVSRGPQAMARKVHTLPFRMEDFPVVGKGLYFSLIPREQLPRTFLHPGKQVFVDADQLDFPLEVRPWKVGDRFRPLGMTGTKTVARFLSDQKVPRDQRAGVFVVSTAKHVIIWCVPFRIAEGFQVTPGTRRVLRISTESTLSD